MQAIQERPLTAQDRSDAHKQHSISLELIRQRKTRFETPVTHGLTPLRGIEEIPEVEESSPDMQENHDTLDLSTSQTPSRISNFQSDRGGIQKQDISPQHCSRSNCVHKETHVHSRITWDQSKTRITLNIHIRARYRRTKVHISDSGKVLNFEAEVILDSVKPKVLLYQISLELYSSVVVKEYKCLELSDHLSLELEKSPLDSHLVWPKLFIKEEHRFQRVYKAKTRCHSDHSKQSDTEDKKAARLENHDEPPSIDLDCFQDISLYLSQMNKQSSISAPKHSCQTKTTFSKTNNLDTSLEVALRKYFGDLQQTQERDQGDSSRENTNQTKLKQEITGDFGRPGDLRPQETDKMKHDYRREISFEPGSAIDSGRNTAKYALDFRKTYLFLYNVLLFVLFLMVFMILTIKVLSGTIDDDTVQGSAFIIKILTYTQLLESVHPLLGLVPGGPLMPFLQVIGRLIVNHFLSEPAIRIDSAPYAHYLFIVWSSIEIFRYSFYALRVFKVDIYPITWCRYTLFMPLYPMGGFCESQVIMSTIKYYGKTGTYSVGLPNSANISFHLPTFLNFYTFVLLGPSILYLMRYMWSQRCKQLRKEKSA